MIKEYPKKEDARKSVSDWKETNRLLSEAVVAVNALSNHLANLPDKPRMYKANQALHKLWEIE